jgi:hypothetical protein
MRMRPVSSCPVPPASPGLAIPPVLAVRNRAGGPNLRLAAARVALPLGARRREIRRLLARTADAFGRPLPPWEARSARGLLTQYALFTREQAEAALEGLGDVQTLERRLFAAASALGAGYRLRLGVRCFRDAVAAARLIYAALGIDFSSGPDGEVEIRRCAFAAFYTPRICALISALDRGLLAGLTAGGELQFRERLTEGAPACRASLRGGRA